MHTSRFTSKKVMAFLGSQKNSAKAGMWLIGLLIVALGFTSASHFISF